MSVQSYSREDFKKFAETVCNQLDLKALRSIIDFYDGDPSMVHSYIVAIKNGKRPTNVVNIAENITKGQIDFHKSLYRVLYETDLRSVLKLVNDTEENRAVMRWRLKIGK